MIPAPAAGELTRAGSFFAASPRSPEQETVAG
jgi:hypothetical protein